MSERLEKPTAWTQTRNRRRTIALRGATSRDDRLRRVRPAWLARGHRPDGIDVQGHDATDQGSGDALGYRPRRGDDVVRVPVSKQFVGSVLDKGSPCEELGLNRKIGHTLAGSVGLRRISSHGDFSSKLAKTGDDAESAEGRQGVPR